MYRTASHAEIDRLPLHKPPLHVRQWVMTDLSKDLVHASSAERAHFYGLSATDRAKMLTPDIAHKVYARVNPDRWYRMTARARMSAMTAFYKTALKAFRKQGVGDLVLVVAPLSKTTAHMPALAIGRNGSTSLTPLGRNRSHKAL